MKSFIFLALVIFGQIAFAEETLTLGGMTVPKTVFDPPADWSQSEKQKWDDSNCKLRVVKIPDVSTMFSPSMNLNEASCISYARFVAVRIVLQLHPQLKGIFQQDLYVLFDNHKDFKEVCKFIPVKENFDSFPDDAMMNARLAGPEAVRKLDEQLDENFHLECAIY